MRPSLEKWVHLVTFPDGRRIAFESRGSVLRTWNATTGQMEAMHNSGVVSGWQLYRVCIG
jgi:hypothetical protein